ncbi:kinase-like domain-containing protein, partial [Phellopilus nigrolimitatus]
SVLGKGAFGSVLLAETTIDGESGQVAIKVVRRSGVTDVSLVTMIHEEQKLMRYFTTNNGLGYFPQLIESFYDEHNYYLVSEYISGGTLRDEMKRCGGRLPLSRVKFIMAQCMVIVGFMHEHGVMHRDIKPENILIDAVGNVVFTDLGLARRFCYVLATDVGVIVDGHVRTSVSGCGTPGYMAPEVLLGERYSKQVDMYSLGCLMYEMVFGVLPFRQRNMNDLASAVIEGSYKLPAHCNVDLMTLDMISGVSRLSRSPLVELTDESLAAPRGEALLS